MTNPARPARAVVGAHDHLGEGSELLVEQHALAGAGAQHDDHLGAELGESASDRKHHGCADPAGHADRGAIGDEIARPAERTDDVVDPVAGSQRHQIGRALADRLDDEDDRALCRVAVGDRERDAFGAGTEPDDDELTGLACRGDPGSPDDQLVHVGRQLRVGQDLVARNARVARALVIGHRARS